MKNHWKKHADEGFFTCEFCAEIFNSNEQFRVHMATHDAIEQEKGLIFFVNTEPTQLLVVLL